MDPSVFRLDSPFWTHWISGALVMFSWLAVCAGGLFGILTYVVVRSPADPHGKNAERGSGLIGS